MARGVRIVLLRGLLGLALAAVATLPGSSGAARAQGFLSQFRAAVTAVHGTLTFNVEENVVGTLTDGASYSLPFTLDRVTFTGGQFTIASTYTFASATQSGNVITFTGVHSTAEGSAPYTCSIDLATGGSSGNCEGFLGLGGVTATQQAVAASSLGILRDETRAVSTMIGDRVRDIARDLARGQGTGATTGRGAQSARPLPATAAGPTPPAPISGTMRPGRPIRAPAPPRLPASTPSSATAGSSASPRATTAPTSLSKA